MKNKIPIFTGFNDPVNKELDVILNKLTKLKLTKIGSNYYWANMTFEDDENNWYYVEYWNSNKWYAWFSEGKICLNGSQIFKWRYTRPKRSTMNRILKELKIYKKNHEYKMPH